MTATPDHAPGPQPLADGSVKLQARVLLRSAHMGMLATAVAEEPHAALVTPACMPDLSVVLLLSELSRHTAQLRANPRCALLCTAQPHAATALANPQTLARLSLTCDAVVDDDAAVGRRYLALHPYAQLYAGLGDFHFWRLQVRQGLFVQGFARATPLSADAFSLPAGDAAALKDVENEVMRTCNASHVKDLELIGRAHGGYGDDWRLAAVDPEGFDLIGATGRVWVAWPQPVHALSGCRTGLTVLGRRAALLLHDGPAGPGARGSRSVP
jgi:putative heme iron utilization protein